MRDPRYDVLFEPMKIGPVRPPWMKYRSFPGSGK